MAPTNDGLLAAVWVLTAAAILFTIGRYIIRWTVRHRFYADDVCHLFSIMFLLAWAIEGTVFFPMVPYWLSVLAKKVPRPASFETGFLHYRRLQITGSLLVWITLWLVKGTFLLLYRLIFGVSSGFMKAWWVVVATTFVLFWVPIAGVLTTCGATANLYDLSVCAEHTQYDRTVLEYSCVANVFTDLIIMILPLSLLRKLQMRLTQKLGLALIFSLAFITIAFDILRTYESVVGVLYTSPGVYTTLEAGFAVITACLPVYRGLVGIERKTKGPQYLDVGLPGQQTEDGQPLTALQQRKTSKVKGSISEASYKGGQTVLGDTGGETRNATRREWFEDVSKGGGDGELMA